MEEVVLCIAAGALWVYATYVVLAMLERKRVYPGNIQFDDSYEGGIVIGHFQRVERFTGELDVSIQAIQRMPTYEEMVDCLLTIDYDERLYAFGTLVLIGFFENCGDMLNLSNATRIVLRDLLCKHFDISNFIYERRYEWCRFNLHRYLACMKILFQQGMRKDNVIYMHSFYGLLSVSSAASMTFPTSILYNLYTHFEDVTFLYNYLLDIFTYSEIVECEEHYKKYVLPPLLDTRRRCNETCKKSNKWIFCVCEGKRNVIWTSL
jgi:hypothetical protein